MPVSAFARCRHGWDAPEGGDGPIGDLSRCNKIVRLIDHVVGERQQLVWNGQAKRAGSSEVDD